MLNGERVKRLPTNGGFIDAGFINPWEIKTVEIL